jgi:hypothetical protein
MPSHLIALAVSAIFLNSFLAVYAEEGTSEPRNENKTQSKLTTANKAPAEGRRIYTSRLYGSLCASCLKHLNDELNKRRGVFESTIERAVKKEAHDGEPATYEKWANAKVVYDASKLSKDDITKRIKESDFIVRRVEDVGENESTSSSEASEPGSTTN